MQYSKPKFVFKLFFYLLLQDYTYKLLFFYGLYLNFYIKIIFLLFVIIPSSLTFNHLYLI